VLAKFKKNPYDFVNESSRTQFLKTPEGLKAATSALKRAYYLKSAKSTADDMDD
jgi:hypothetical protein